MLKHDVAAIALAMMIAVPSTSWGWGVPGCTNLPEYNRALGALQGMTSACDMTVERARRVVAEHDGVAVAEPQVAAQPKVSHRRRRVRSHRR